MTQDALSERRAGVRRRVAAWALVAVAIAESVALALRGRISQAPSYHAFPDDRPWLGIPNAQNVLSNLPFLAVGLFGLATLRRAITTTHPPARWERAAFVLLSLGLLGTAIGSSIYHLDPRDATLVWDRVPMTLVFSPFLALLLGERLGSHVGRLALGPLVVLGVGSVVYWAATIDGRSGDDLRPYVFVQAFTMIAPAVLLVVVPDPRATRWPLAFAFLAYLGAKQLEGLDVEIYEGSGHLVSGHTLKHLAAAVAAAFLVQWFGRRFAADGTTGTPSPSFH